MKKRTKIIILSLMIVLLGVTGYLNIVLNNSITEPTNTTTTTSYFVSYRNDRETSRDQQILYYDAIIDNESSSEEAVQNAENAKLELIAQMEKELDEIAEGHDDYVHALTTFEDKFEPLLENAYDKMEQIQPQKTGEICPECGGDLVIRKGKYGSFVACSNYPTCKYIKKEPETIEYTGETCPKCGSPMIYKTGRYGKFEACSNYPDCKYIKNSKKKEPVMTDEVCPNCGSPVVIKQGRWGEFKACSNYPKCKTIIK